MTDVAITIRDLLRQTVTGPTVEAAAIEDGDRIVDDLRAGQLAICQLMVAIEERFGIEIGAVEGLNCRRVDQLVDLVRRKVGQKEASKSLPAAPAAPIAGSEPAGASQAPPPLASKRRRPLQVGGRVMHIDGRREGVVRQIDANNVLVQWDHGPAAWFMAGFLQAMPSERMSA